MPTLGLFLDVAALARATSRPNGWWKVIAHPHLATWANYSNVWNNTDIPHALVHHRRDRDRRHRAADPRSPRSPATRSRGSTSPAATGCSSVVIALLVVPLQMALIPIFHLYNTLSIYDTVLGLILFHTAFGLPFAIFLLRNFFIGIPKDILESARIDGASEIRIFLEADPAARPAGDRVARDLPVPLDVERPARRTRDGAQHDSRSPSTSSASCASSARTSTSSRRRRSCRWSSRWSCSSRSSGTSCRACSPARSSNSGPALPLGRGDPRRAVGVRRLRRMPELRGVPLLVAARRLLHRGRDARGRRGRERRPFLRLVRARRARAPDRPVGRALHARRRARHVRLAEAADRRARPPALGAAPARRRRAGTTPRSSSARGSSCTGPEPSVDWWEEREGIHAATLWCIGDGLDSDEIRREAIARADDRLDASQLFIGTPELVERVESTLVSPGGGVWRNLDDEYYGGGEWMLLTAMLGLAQPARRAEDAPRPGSRPTRRRTATCPSRCRINLLRPERYRALGREMGQAGVSAALVACDVPSTAPCPQKPCAARSSVAGSPHSRRTRRCVTAGVPPRRSPSSARTRTRPRSGATRAAAIRQQRMRSESRRALAAAAFPGLAVREAARALRWRRSLRASRTATTRRVDDFLEHAESVRARERLGAELPPRARSTRIARGRRRVRASTAKGRSPRAGRDRAIPGSRVRPSTPARCTPTSRTTTRRRWRSSAPGMAAATEWLNALAAGGGGRLDPPARAAAPRR